MTVHIRHGVKFSPPVNREVTSADVAYAIERGANPNVANAYFPAYFNYISGASKATGGPIPGISTPDKYTIVFHLTGPYGTFFVRRAVAAADRAGAEGVRWRRSTRPSRRRSARKYLVATGPYMFKADSKGEFLGNGYQTGQVGDARAQPELEREHSDPRPAYLDQINIHIGGDRT